MFDTRRLLLLTSFVNETNSNDNQAQDVEYLKIKDCTNEDYGKATNQEGNTRRIERKLIVF